MLNADLPRTKTSDKGKIRIQQGAVSQNSAFSIPVVRIQHRCSALPSCLACINGASISSYKTMPEEALIVRGAREHNLRNIDVTIPRDRLTVITGLSGSGKSSLAFDTIYAEGQRRYVESLSAYARQFLGLMEKPDVDSIEGLSPAISIEQKTAGHN